MPSFSSKTQEITDFRFALQHKNKSLAKSKKCITLKRSGKSSRSEGDRKMSWKTPKIVEVQVGMEINMYACAARK